MWEPKSHSQNELLENLGGLVQKVGWVIECEMCCLQQFIYRGPFYKGVRSGRRESEISQMKGK